MDFVSKIKNWFSVRQVIAIIVFFIFMFVIQTSIFENPSTLNNLLISGFLTIFFVLINSLFTFKNNKEG
jgi:amino acid permease